MHHFIFPSKDTYVTNRSSLEGKNFGIDEILQVGTRNTPIEVLETTKDYIYTNVIFNSQGVSYFTGIFSGSFGGTIAFASGSISGSNLDFSASYFSGSINGGTIVELSGSVLGTTVVGYMSGSVISPYVIGEFVGQLTGSIACFTGTGSGVDTRDEQHWTTRPTQFIDRALLKFDLTAISISISSGAIANPKFAIKLKVCNEYNLPITYAIFALPISQSWNMGDGYMSDEGSDSGVSWVYRDNNFGTEWFSSSVDITPRPPIDFINNPSLLTASFAYGGGTWYSSSWCSQSFRYQSADIDMDVTSMVMVWLSGSIPNEGMILIGSDELQATGSGFYLKFYSRDTNTIYSPYLDVMWDDIALAGGYITGSESTGSVTITTVASGISASIQSGSSLVIDGGVSGSFSGSAFIMTSANYITASEQIFNYNAPADSSGNSVWYANNGYHYDNWQSAWDLDPYHGGFLPNTDIQVSPTPPDYGSAPIFNFTGSFTGSLNGSVGINGTISGSGQFTASYFSGSVDGVDQEGNNVNVSGSVSGSISGSVITVGFLGLYRGQLSSSLVYLNGTGSGTYLDPVFLSFGGFVDGMGLKGNIAGVPVFGTVLGLVTISQSLVTGPCGKSFSASLAKAILTSGPFSGSAFTAYYVDYKFENALLSGSWTEAALLGTKVNIPLPSPIAPYAYAYVSGIYVNGKALGIYTISGSNSAYGTASAGANSASFVGQFVDGNLLGGTLNLQLSGSVATSSYSYTSSVEMSSSMMTALDASRPFTVIVSNMCPIYKAGDIIKMEVFARKQYPLKTFGKTTQQSQYLIPEFLPTSSYYALKDNETDEIVMNFDSYTKIGCQYPAGNYFVIDTTNLPQDRYYRVLIRVDDGQSIYTFDCGKTFQLTR